MFVYHKSSCHFKVYITFSWSMYSK